MVAVYGASRFTNDYELRCAAMGISWMDIDELSQATYSTHNSGKIVIDKMPNGALAPNLADSGVMSAWPVPQARVLI